MNLTNHRTQWKPEEDQFLKQNYAKMSRKKIGQILGRSGYAVGHRAKFLKIESKIKPSQNRIYMPVPIEIAWSAGIYEGEGSVHKRTKTSKRISATVTQKDRWILEILIELWGGSIYIQKNGVSNWFIYGDKAEPFLYVIYPYLSPRRKEQIDIARASYV